MFKATGGDTALDLVAAPLRDVGDAWLGVWWVMRGWVWQVIAAR